MTLNAQKLARKSAWIWSEHAGVVVSKNLECYGGPIDCFMVRWNGREARIDIERTASRVGRDKVWFLCPSCGRRCRDVHLPADHPVAWGCRVCLRLSYAVEAETLVDRMQRRKWKLEAAMKRARPGTKKYLRLYMAIERTTDRFYEGMHRLVYGAQK